MYRHNNKKCEVWWINDLIEYKCLRYNKICHRKFDEKLKGQFFNAYKFSNHGNNKFVLFLQKTCFILINIWLIEKNLLKDHKIRLK